MTSNGRIKVTSNQRVYNYNRRVSFQFSEQCCARVLKSRDKPLFINFNRTVKKSKITKLKKQLCCCFRKLKPH